MQIHYLEIVTKEVDAVCARATALGFGARVAQDAFIYHIGRQTFARVGSSIGRASNSTSSRINV